MLLTIIIGFGGCKNFKNTKFGHFYHNMTAHYNAYFNGKEKLKLVEQKLYDATEDNYAMVLSVFPIGTEAAAKSSGGDCDIIIKKATKVIKKHDVSDWVDDAYLLIGKALYYKREYYQAIETFEFVAGKYNKEVTGLEAQMWIARCYLELNKFNDAIAQITFMKALKNVPDWLKGQYYVTEADYYIRNDEYKLAAEKLEKSIPDIRVRKYRIRYYFILGQLYAKIGNVKKSSYFYNEVIHRVSPYEISFQAKMGLADSYELQSSKEKKKIREFLVKLTKDTKTNGIYLDQVYYQLSKISLKEGNMPKTLAYLKLSAHTSVRNKYQKAISYSTLGDLYFKMPDYPNAKMFYDSANFTANSKGFTSSEVFKKRQKTLSDLIANLIVIHDQDSLQKMAMLSSDEVDKIIDKKIADQKAEDEQKNAEAEAAKKRAEQQQLDDQANQNQQNNYAVNFDNGTPGGGMPGGGLPGGNNTMGSNAPGGAGGSNNPGASGAAVDPTAMYGNSDANAFYFDNPALVTQGTADFMRKWGRRPLQDDWRRKTKAVNPIQDNSQTNNDPKSANNGDGTKTVDSAAKAAAAKVAPKDLTANMPTEVAADKKSYYKDIPYTKLQLKYSNKKIEDALFNSGSIYYEQLKELEKAALKFEDLVARFPDSKYLLKAHYYLFKIYDELKLDDKRDQHKNFILNNYPGSEYAMLIKSPELLRQKLARKVNPELEELYTKTFDFYKQDKCEEVQANFTASLQTGNNYLLPKFDYLRAICPLKHDTGTALTDTLKAFAKRYPGDEMAREADRLIKLLEEKRIQARYKPKSSDTIVAEKPSPYKKNDTIAQFYVFSFPIEKSNLNKIKVAFSNYNTSNFANENLEITATIIGNDNIIIVRNFGDIKRALNYFNTLKRDTEFYDNFNLPSHREFVISEDNFKILQQDKDFSLYQKFFNAKY